LQFETTSGGALLAMSNQNRKRVLHSNGTDVMHEFAPTRDADAARKANEAAASIETGVTGKTAAR
jgi:hypothetical protein